MVGAGERVIEAILVTGNTEEILPPCGACRQVIAEFSRPDTPVYMCSKKGDRQKATVSQLLPYTLSFHEVLGHERRY